MFADAFQSALSVVRETRTAIKQPIKRPADPNAVRVPPEQRDAEFSQLISDPAVFSSEFGRAAARFNLPESKPIPKRFVQRLIEGYKRAG